MMIKRVRPRSIRQSRCKTRKVEGHGVKDPGRAASHCTDVLCCQWHHDTLSMASVQGAAVDTFKLHVDCIKSTTPLPRTAGLLKGVQRTRYSYDAATSSPTHPLTRACEASHAALVDLDDRTSWSPVSGCEPQSYVPGNLLEDLGTFRQSGDGSNCQAKVRQGSVGVHAAAND